MTTRLGYLAALVSGRHDGPLLQPPRPLFPPVGLADAELGWPEAATVPEPGPLSPTAVPGRSAPATAAPARTPPTSSGPAPRRPAAVAASQRSRANGVMNTGATGQTPDDTPGQPGRDGAAESRSAARGRPASQAPGGGGTTGSTAHPGLTERTRAAAAPPRIGISEAPAAGPGVPPTHNGADVTAELPGPPRVAVTGTVGGARPGASAASSLDGGRVDSGPPALPTSAPPAGGPASQAPGGSGTTGSTAHPGLTERARAGTAPPRIGISEAPAAGPGVPPTRNRADVTGALPGYPGLAVTRTADGARPATSTASSTAAASSPAAGASALSADPPRRQPVIQAVAGELSGRYLRHEGAAVNQLAGPQPAGDMAGPPLHRREASGPAETSPATLSIGTIEITVVAAAQSTAHPRSPRPGRVSPPDRLSRGLGPWFGWDQA